MMHKAEGGFCMTKGSIPVTEHQICSCSCFLLTIQKQKLPCLKQQWNTC